jgi:hypothetical protein
LQRAEISARQQFPIERRLSIASDGVPEGFRVVFSGSPDNAGRLVSIRM